MYYTEQDILNMLVAAEGRKLDAQVVSNIILTDSVRRQRALKNWEVYKASHDIVNRPQDDFSKPNNKLVNDYPGLIVDTALGYFMGIPVTYSSDNTDLIDFVNEVRRNNNEELTNERHTREMGITGVSYEIVYFDEQSKPRFMKIPKAEGLLIKDKSVEQKIQYFIRYFPMEFDAGEMWYVEIYDREKIGYYELSIITDQYGKKQINFLPDPNREPQMHFFNDVPVVEYCNNESMLGDFDKVITLVDDYDRQFSDNSNDLESFAKAYLILKGMDVTKETLDVAKRLKSFTVPEAGDIAYLTKQIDDAVNENHLNRLDKNIHKFSQTPDMTDENFAGNLSGVAMRFKLSGLETKCVSKERYFLSGLRRRWDLIFTAKKNVKLASYDVNDLDVHFTRNVPANVVELADIATKLKGVVSNETLLGQLPFVDDVNAELDRLKTEQEDSMNYSALGANIDTEQGDINAAE